MQTHIGKKIPAIIIFILAHGQAYAAPVDCTSIITVTITSFVTHNNQYGGHLNAHVLGQTPPPQYTQQGRTLFRDANDWNNAYQGLVNQIPALQCDTNAAIGSEAARTLPRQYFSYQCTAADNQGRCTVSNQIQTNHVTYTLRVVSDGNNGKRWIVYTAYPTPK